MSTIALVGGSDTRVVPVVQAVTASVVSLGGCQGASMLVNARGEVYITRRGEGSYRVNDDFSLFPVQEIDFEYGQFYQYPLGKFLVRDGVVSLVRGEVGIISLGALYPQQLTACRFGACFFNRDGDACILVIKPEGEE